MSNSKSPESESPESGSPGSGSPDSESRDSGSPDSGSPGSESPDSGSPSSGAPDSESRDSASPGSDRTEPARSNPDTAVDDRLRYDGTAGEFAKIALTNTIASIATLGIYRFWGKTRERRYLWGGIRFLGDRAEYAGTGRELLLGFVIALAILGLLFGVSYAIQLVFVDVPWVGVSAQVVHSLALLYLVFVAQYRARRYRLSRTRWRSIRFSQDGSSLQYGLIALGWSVVVILSLGTAYAVYRTRLQRYRSTHTSFGDRRFGFEARAMDLLKSWLLSWILLVPTLGLSYVWYRVREFRYFVGKSRCSAFTFRSDLRTAPVIMYILAFIVGFVILMVCLVAASIAFASSALLPELAGLMEGATGMLPDGSDPAQIVILVATLVIFMPTFKLLQTLLLVHPLFGEIFGSVSVVGEEDLATIAQSRQAAPGRGEGLADALDVGAV